MDDPVLYGELAILGINGHLPGSNDRRGFRSKIALHKRPKANGVRPGSVTKFSEPRQSTAFKNRNTPTVSYTLSRSLTVVVEYDPDPDVDLFQVGRSFDDHIDFVITEPRFLLSNCGQSIGSDATEDPQFQLISNCAPKQINRESSVSRFACRIHIQRDPPHVARLYAAGFDSSNNIFLGERAIKWKLDDSMDGLTTNGVMMLRFTPEEISQLCMNSEDKDVNDEVNNNNNSKFMNWREVSVCGSVYEMSKERCIPKETNRVSEDNILTDMTLIDLCGITLLWRSGKSLESSVCPDDLINMINKLNETHIQCPVLFRTLKLPHLDNSKSRHVANNSSNYMHLHRRMLDVSRSNSVDQIPYVYVNCGHVHGLHDWLANGDVDDKSRTCPLCLRPSPFVPLQMGHEAAFCVDRELATHCFNPCGHIASENTVRFWCSIRLPNWNNFELHSRCPFCLTQLCSTKPVRLMFQNDTDLVDSIPVGIQSIAYSTPPSN